MRIRDFSVRDLGKYQCHITCEDRRGRIQHQYYYVDVCLKENHSQQSKTKQLEQFPLRILESHRMTQFSCREKVKIVELIFVTGVINARMATTY